MAREYTEHKVLEVGPLLVADATLQSGKRMVWLGAGGMEGRWVTHQEYRAIVARLVAFADALPAAMCGVCLTLSDSMHREHDCALAQACGRVCPRA